MHYINLGRISVISKVDMKENHSCKFHESMCTIYPYHSQMYDVTFGHFHFFAVFKSVLFYLNDDANILLVSHLQSLYMTSFKTMMHATK